jgi:hypothetical protein
MPYHSGRPDGARGAGPWEEVSAMPFGSLWIPVLASAVAVFVASSLLHMFLKYHQADHRPLPAEDAVRDALGRADLAPGVYMTPHCTHQQMKDPAMLAKFQKGPVAIITALPKGMPNMGKHLGLWFGLCFLVSFSAAYVARHTLQPGAPGMLVMQITGVVAFAGYNYGQLSDTIWKGQPWPNTLRHLLDGAIYAVITAILFKALWPAA